MRRDVFQAIADPTRRAIINRIAHHPLNVNTVSEQFDVSRTAVYKHIKILTECGLIVIKQQGRERFCEARLDKLSEVSDWVEQYRQLWNHRLDALDKYLQVLQAGGIGAAPKKNTAKNIGPASKKIADRKIADKGIANKKIAVKKAAGKKVAGKKPPHKRMS
ncbi:ArsR/SmtB family transcription factor [Flavitalea flava]